MPLVATLISNPAASLLTQPLVDRATAAAGASATRWLAHGIACDLSLGESRDAGAVERNLRAALQGLPIDIVIQQAEGRAKRLLIADMDSTMIDQECIDELADAIGLKAHVAAITARAMNGGIAFEPALRERVSLLKGLDIAVIDRVIDERLTLAAGGATLVRTMRSHGAFALLVSGGFESFTTRIAAMLGFDEHRANTLLVEDCRLTGTVAEPILGRAAKADALIETTNRLGLTPFDAIAVGDGANDLDMLQLAGSGVALHAKPSVAAQARMRIDHGDLTALLYIQGYARTDFAA